MFNFYIKNGYSQFYHPCSSLYIWELRCRLQQPRHFLERFHQRMVFHFLFLWSRKNMYERDMNKSYKLYISCVEGSKLSAFFTHSSYHIILKDNIKWLLNRILYVWHVERIHSTMVSRKVMLLNEIEPFLYFSIFFYYGNFTSDVWSLRFN